MGIIHQELERFVEDPLTVREVIGEFILNHELHETCRRPTSARNNYTNWPLLAKAGWMIGWMRQ